MIEGKIEDIYAESAFFVVKDAEFKKLENPVIGTEFEINDHRGLVVGLAKVASGGLFGIPTVYTTYNRAITYIPSMRFTTSYVLIEPKSEADIPFIQQQVKKLGYQALTRDQFVGKISDFYTYQTGMGMNVLMMTAISFIVGLSISGQTFYTFILENMERFGALKAIGAKGHELIAMILFQASFTALLGYGIGVGLVSLVMFPDLPMNQKEDGFVYVMKAVLPPGLKGLLIAAFLAAYMSTLSTHLNWGTSYLINDFYKRFLKTDGDAKHYVTISKITTFLTAAFALYITFFVLETITGAWEFIIQCGAGTGFVLILRWFWWRLNAWSEITSMVAPFIAFTWIQLFTAITFPFSIFIIVGFTITATLIVTFLTPPTETAQLETFYRTTRVGGVLWKKISKNLPDVESDTGFAMLFVDWALGVIMIYAILFGTGRVIFGDLFQGFLFLGVGSIAGALIFADLNRRGWNNLN